MDLYSSEITKLIDELSSLPGIGAKTAQRLALLKISPKNLIFQKKE